MDTTGLRAAFEKLFPVPEGVEWFEHLSNYDSNNDLPLSVADSHNDNWQGFQAGHAAEQERIAELEAENARLRGDAGRFSQYLCDEDDTYADIGDYLDSTQPEIGNTFSLTKCYSERIPTTYRVISRGLDISGHPIIDAEEICAAKEASK